MHSSGPGRRRGTLLYLRCALCDRKQTDGLLSGAAWGRLELPPTAAVEHAALSGSTLRACPTCVQRNPDWQSELLGSLGLEGQAASWQTAS